MVDRSSHDRLCEKARAAAEGAAAQLRAYAGLQFADITPDALRELAGLLDQISTAMNELLQPDRWDVGRPSVN